MRRLSQQNKRGKKGSILLLIIFLVCFVVVPAIIIFGQMALYQVARARAQTVVEAAGLVAANDLSRIIIDDSHFGYVSLSNYPPIGKGTCAADGEPLPVLGINNLVGTIRQNTIIAHELNNKIMAFLADTDREKMQSTIKDLNDALSESLVGDRRESFHDIQGVRVEPLKDVSTFLRANLPKGIQLRSIKLTNGCLTDAGDSTVPVPQPLRLAQLKPEVIRAGKYKSFSDVPAVGRSFTFAGLGSSSSLVSAASFHQADGKHICSIVKIECTFDLAENCQPLAPFGIRTCSQVHATACCQPFSIAEAGPAGAMTLRFSGGPVSGLENWRDFLSGGFRDNQITTYDAVGGDYPVNHEAHMIASEPLLPPNTSQQFAEHLYYWLRNGHLRPHIDAVLDMMNDSFRSGPAQIYAYEFARNGTISRRIIARDPFPIGVTSEAQNQTVIDTSIQGGLSPIIVFRDDVKVLGTEHGGRHAGQPLAGYPLNWCELPEYGGDEHVAAGLEKGRLGTRLTIVDTSGTALPEEAINDPNFGIFQNFEGRKLFHQPRRSFYSGGLALDIEIGGTTAPQPVLIAAPVEPPPAVAMIAPTLPLPSVNASAQAFGIWTAPGACTSLLPAATLPAVTSVAEVSPAPAQAIIARPSGPAPLPPILNIPSKRFIFAGRKI